MYFGIWGLTGFIHVQCVWFLLLVYICMYVGWDLGFGSLRPRVVFLFMCRNHVIVWSITLVLARMLRNVIKLMPLGSMIILGVEGFWVLQEYSYSCTSTSIVVLHMTILCDIDKPFFWLVLLGSYRRLIVYSRWIWLGLLMRNVNDCVFSACSCMWNVILISTVDLNIWG
jgi:hypothetical protein